MAYPPKFDYEKVALGIPIAGVISNIDYEDKHVFKSKDGEKTMSAVRLVLKLDGYEYPHRSRWMTFSYDERSNLFQKYLSELILGAMPEMEMDLDVIKGMRVSTVWGEQNDFQFIESISPIGEKRKISDVKLIDPEGNDVEAPEDGDAPF